MTRPIIRVYLNRMIEQLYRLFMFALCRLNLGERIVSLKVQRPCTNGGTQYFFRVLGFAQPFQIISQQGQGWTVIRIINQNLAEITIGLVNLPLELPGLACTPSTECVPFELKS